MAQPPPTRLLDGKKFMWDGALHQAREPAQQAAEGYRAQQFETRVVEEEGHYLVYTRRAVKRAAAS